MSVLISSFVFVIQIFTIFADLPPMTKCKVSNSTCLKTMAQTAVPVFAVGMPEINMEPLDVMEIDIVKVDLAGLNLIINDSHVKGLKKTVIDKLSIDTVKKQVNLVFHTDIAMKGLYKASGRLLILPISGDGQVSIKLKHITLNTEKVSHLLKNREYVKVEITMPYEVTKNSEGKDVIDLKSYKYKTDVKTDAHFQLSNLFNGNKQLSDTMHTFMNENWKALVQEFGRPLFEVPTARIFKSIKAYLKTHPLKEIVDV
ncbi:circadian clock-controlled protein daywake [Aphomia sociella]